MTELSTVTVSDVIARRPCGDWSSRIPAFGERYRRETWSALEILSLDGVSAEDRRCEDRRNRRCEDRRVGRRECRRE